MLVIVGSEPNAAARGLQEALAAVTSIRREVRLASRQDEKDKLTRKYQGLHPDLTNAVDALVKSVNVHERLQSIGASCGWVGK